VVAVINNPTWTGGLTDPSGQNVGQAMNGIASAFMNTGQQALAQQAIQQAQQKQAALNNISDVFGKYNDASQDYQQDAPDYSTPQPAPRIDLSDPAAFARSLITLGNPSEIGKSLQLASAIQGGVNAPGVGIGSIPGGGYAQTPEGIASANQLSIQKTQADQTNAANLDPVQVIKPDGTLGWTTKGAIAAGQAPAAQPAVGTDLVKGSQTQRMVFTPGQQPAEAGDDEATPGAAKPAATNPAMTPNQTSILGLDEKSATPMTPEQQAQFARGYTDANGVPHYPPQTASREHVVGANLVDASGKVLFSATPGSTLDPAAIDQLAQRSVLGDHSGLVGLGRAAQGAANLVAVQNRAAQIAIEKGLDPQSVLDNIAAFGGEKAGARTAGQLGTKLDVFGTSASAALDYAAAKSAALPRGQGLPVNQVQQMIQRGSNNPDLAVLNAATETAVNEYTRAIGLSGASTDTAKSHAYEMLNTAQSPEAYQAVVNGLKFEIDNLHRATQGVRAGVNILARARQGSRNSRPPAPVCKRRPFPLRRRRAFSKPTPAPALCSMQSMGRVLRPRF
jgi:hypothetical protein